MDRLAVASSVVSKINKRRVNPHGTSTKKAGEGATKHCNFMNKFREHQCGHTTTLQDATLSFIHKNLNAIVMVRKNQNRGRDSKIFPPALSTRKMKSHSRVPRPKLVMMMMMM